MEKIIVNIDAAAAAAERAELLFSRMGKAPKRLILNFP